MKNSTFGTSRTPLRRPSSGRIGPPDRNSWPITQSAIIRQLEIAGEAAGRLSEEFRQSHPELEARRLKALRNVLIHGYADVDLETVWDVVRHDLPSLEKQLRSENVQSPQAER